MARIHGDAGFKIEDAGEIVTDRFGLDSGNVVWHSEYPERANKGSIFSLTDLPQKGDPHPYAPWLKMVRRRLKLEPEVCKIIGEFEGVAAGTEPVYTLQVGLSEEPIESHPNFSVFAGKPSYPRNGALFVDGSGQITTDDGTGVFAGFSAYTQVGTAVWKNTLWAGIKNYLDFSRAVWTASYYTPTKPSDAYDSLGRISTPIGDPPRFKWRDSDTDATTRNWLYMGLDLEQRGGAYKVSHQWCLSAVGNWNGAIYGFELDDVLDE